MIYTINKQASLIIWSCYIGICLVIVSWLLVFASNEAQAGVIGRAPNNLGLVGYWSFNDATSTNTGYPNRAVDFSGQGNQLQFNQQSGDKTTWINGVRGRGISINNANDQGATIQGVDSSLYDGGNALSVSFWLRMINKSATQIVVSKWNHVVSDAWLIQLASGNGSLYFYIANSQTDAGSNNGSTAAGLLSNNWHHVTTVFNGNGSDNTGRMQIYIDGVSQSLAFNGTIPATMQNSSDLLRLGTLQGIGQWLSADLDEVRVYNRALSAEEVKALYKSGAAKFTPPSNLGLVGYWSFNDATSTTRSTHVQDFSGNNNNGVMTNMANPATAVSGVASGKLSKALNFDGSDDYVDISDSDLFTFPAGGNGFSVSAWVYKKSSTAVSGGMVDKYQSGTGLEWVLSNFGPEGITSFLVYDATQAAFIARDAPMVSSNMWHHIIGTYDGGTTAASIKIYFDGTRVDNANRTSGIFVTMRNTVKQVRIGSFTTFEDTYFSGLIDEVRIYNRALSNAEVTALYKSGQAKFTPPSNLGLVGYWSFNDATSTTRSTIVQDFSGNNNNGIMTNMANPATAVSGVADGKLGKALNFDGSNDYVDAGSGENLEAPTLTVSAWIKRNVTGVRNAIVIDSINSAADANHFFWFEANSSNTLTLAFGDGVTHGTVFSTRTITDTNWHHVAVYRNDATEKIQFFIDGVPDGEQNYRVTLGTLIALGTNNLRIGMSNTTGYNVPFNGLIDEVRVYNRALSAEEVQALYNSR